MWPETNRKSSGFFVLKDTTWTFVLIKVNLWASRFGLRRIEVWFQGLNLYWTLWPGRKPKGPLSDDLDLSVRFRHYTNTLRPNCSSNFFIRKILKPHRNQKGTAHTVHSYRALGLCSCRIEVMSCWALLLLITFLKHFHS